jgi:hypothetical protein
VSAETGRRVIIDVNIFENLRQIDAKCELLELICECYQGRGMGDSVQLGMLHYCKSAACKLECIDISDETIAEFIHAHDGPHLQKTFADPVDIKLLAFAVSLRDCVLLTCDKKLLMTAAHYDIVLG